jgi:hypothetical protein
MTSTSADSRVRHTRRLRLRIYVPGGRRLQYAKGGEEHECREQEQYAEGEGVIIIHATRRPAPFRVHVLASDHPPPLIQWPLQWRGENMAPIPR